ncbi:hypothetical protein [Alteromonas sp.]|mgnify:FL=1|jgi:hypothetical protein|uniref:hypothetical protein n=1 Tax=Alteromonas sp. TaxID=232 RepID=UPI003ADB04C2|tara:strand:+ start:1511 stop:2074 length:564 start_codon:yes stop_codon:yes gene_type:complete
MSLTNGCTGQISAVTFCAKDAQKPPSKICSVRRALGFQEMDTMEYEIDANIIDRYERFTIELVRISFAAIGFLGFFFGTLSTSPDLDLEAKKIILHAISNSSIAFSACILFGMSHRLLSLLGISMAVLVNRNEQKNTEKCSKLAKRRKQAFYCASATIGIACICALIGLANLLIGMWAINNHFGVLV